MGYSKLSSQLFINRLLKMKFFALLATSVLSIPNYRGGYMSSGAEPSSYMCSPWTGNFPQCLGFMNSGAEPSSYYNWPSYGRYLNSGSEPSYYMCFPGAPNFPQCLGFMKSGAEPSSYMCSPMHPLFPDC
jgi:hypothetical protein